jgi:hypothetical protein
MLVLRRERQRDRGRECMHAGERDINLKKKKDDVIARCGGKACNPSTQETEVKGLLA